MFCNIRLGVFIVIISLTSVLSGLSYSHLYSYNIQDLSSNYKKDNKLLAKIQETHIELYSLASEKDVEKNGEYRKIMLKVKDKKKEFSWHVDIGESFKPILILSDINSDGVDELIIIITTGHGTGVYTQEVHVVKVNSLDEIKVINPLKVISKNVKTKMTKEDNNIDIKVDINGKLFKKSIKESESELWFDDVVFGNVINYDVVNNKLIAIIAAGASPTLRFGEVVISYMFKDGVLQPSNIFFREYKE
ncbi:hypothetical protein [Clostridium sardiniense]|uniref:hypothetical protein n=1 Tax=Clostridium sardiniense TaxID=29369 RepID=UPI00195642F1|nr:hypothetical protein [Clostridium sardiniense]MBM7834842.1 hypothetical protein [Clostridium sardiniense]